MNLVEGKFVYEPFILHLVVPLNIAIVSVDII